MFKNKKQKYTSDTPFILKEELPLVTLGTLQCSVMIIGQKKSCRRGHATDGKDLRLKRENVKKHGRKNASSLPRGAPRGPESIVKMESHKA